MVKSEIVKSRPDEWSMFDTWSVWSGCCTGADADDPCDVCGISPGIKYKNEHLTNCIQVHRDGRVLSIFSSVTYLFLHYMWLWYWFDYCFAYTSLNFYCLTSSLTNFESYFQLTNDCERSRIQEMYPYHKVNWNNSRSMWLLVVDYTRSGQIISSNILDSDLRMIRLPG